MRISDWSSDVCSSDLSLLHHGLRGSHLLGTGFTHLPGQLATLCMTAVVPGLVPTAFTHLMQERPALGTQRLSSRDLFPGPNTPDHSLVGRSAAWRSRPARTQALHDLATRRWQWAPGESPGRSEARRVGKEWVSTCGYRGSPQHSKK